MADILEHMLRISKTTTLRHKNTVIGTHTAHTVHTANTQHTYTDTIIVDSRIVSYKIWYTYINPADYENHMILESHRLFI